MRTIQVFFLLTIAACCRSQEQTNAQQISSDNPIFQVAKNYFRSNPYNIHFSTFLNHLINDPTLSNKTLNKRSDTAFFFFKGDYSSHNPYSFKADRVEIRLAESEVDLEDSLRTIDTLLFYQLVGYSYGAAGTEAVKREFSKFDRKYGKNLYGEISELKKEEEVVGMVKNYFSFALSLLSPLSITWAKLDDYQNVFTITFRIKIMQNEATLPVAPNDR